MHQIFKTRQGKVSKTYVKAIKKAEEEMDKECEIQTDLVYAAGILTLHREFDWTGDQICEYFHAQEDVYDECAETNKKSMIQMCAEEVGIDMAIEETDTPWQEIIFLNPEFDEQTLTEKQWLYMRIQQKKWVRAQILACFMLTAGRKYNFEEEDLEKLFVGIMRTLYINGRNIKSMVQQCKDEVGFTLTKDPMTASWERRHNGGN